MANEIKVIASLECTKSNFKFPRIGSDTQLITQSGVGGGAPGLVTATTGGVDVDVTALSTLGLCRIQNLDATNYVQWGPKSGGTFYPIGRLNPGEAYVFRLEPATVLHVKANTATCKMMIQILEN